MPPSTTASEAVVMDGSDLVCAGAAWASFETACEGDRQPASHGCDRVGHVPLWPDRERRGGCNARIGEALRTVRRHLLPRGEASPARRSGSRKPRCTAWRVVEAAPAAPLEMPKPELLLE